jgi:hypothetical protein
LLAWFFKKTREMTMKPLRTLLAASLIVTATTASALPKFWEDYLPAWTTTASSCAVDESSSGKYEFVNSQFRYLGVNISEFGLLAAGAAIPSSGLVIRPQAHYRSLSCHAFV